jgi:hypothetical protein
MAGRFPTLHVNVGHVHTYLPLIRPPEDIGIIASAAYPPDAQTLDAPDLRVAVRLLDPITFQLQLPLTNQSDPFKRLPYAAANVDPKLLVSDPGLRSALVGTVAAQSQAWGADLIIAPYFHAVDPDDPAFEASIVMGEETLDHYGSADVVPAVFVHQNALLPQHRDDLLNRLTRTDFDALYLLVGLDLPSTAPISSDAVLAGIRLVVEVLSRNGISVIWGATDTTGLLAAAWAPGTSYALGPDTYLRRRRQPIAGATPRGGYTPAVPRVFARELLSELKVADYQVWTTAGRLPCTCAACNRQGPVAGRLGHYVNAHADLTLQLEHAADPPRELARMVDGALAQIGTGPSDADARRHLNHWRSQLP